MANQEIYDFYVQREDWQKCRNEPLHSVSADLDEHGEVNRNAILYWKKGPNEAMVRVPSICFLGNVIEKKIADFFGVNYKVLTGGHAYIKDDGQMDSLETYWDGTGNYTVTQSSPISCVFPCYENNKRQRAGRMLLGLKFERSHFQSTGQRSFGRQMDSQSGSGGAFDLIDNYLFPDELTSYSSETFNPNLPEPNVLFAIYVCRGARLVVKDDRYYFRPNNRTQAKNRNLCNSLLQMGALVVAEGKLTLGMGFEVIVKVGEEARAVRYNIDWMRAGDGPNSLLDGNEFKRDLEASERIEEFQLENLKTLNQQKRFVIFLGPNESELNSSCWQLSVTTKPRPYSSSAEVECSLLAPQNGRILDIQPWEAGFKQIIWRHKYERLFESVLSPVRTPAFNFEMPNDDQMCRILGIDTPAYDVKVPPICKVPQEMDKDVYYSVYPKKIEIVNIDEFNNVRTEPPAPPPLYPPVWDESAQKLYYLQCGAQPKYNPNSRLFEFNNQEFKLFVKNIKNFNWKCCNTVRPDIANWRFFDQTLYRLGNDYRIYKKTENELGTVDLCYFIRV